MGMPEDQVPSVAECEAHLNDLLASTDLNHDGELDRSEVARIVEMMIQNPPPQQH